MTATPAMELSCIGTAAGYASGRSAWELQDRIRFGEKEVPLDRLIEAFGNKIQGAPAGRLVRAGQAVGVRSNVCRTPQAKNRSEKSPSAIRSLEKSRKTGKRWLPNKEALIYAKYNSHCQPGNSHYRYRATGPDPAAKRRFHHAGHQPFKLAHYRAELPVAGVFRWPGRAFNPLACGPPGGKVSSTGTTFQRTRKPFFARAMTLRLSTRRFATASTVKSVLCLA